MFTAAIILMEMKRPRGQRRCINGVERRPPYQNSDTVSRIRDLRIPGEHNIPSASYGKKTQIPSEFFCKSLHTMHDKDQTGFMLVNRTPPNMKSTTKSTTTSTAVVKPVPASEAKLPVNYKDVINDWERRDGDQIVFACGDDESQRHPGMSRLDDVTKILDGKLGQDGDRLAALQDEITTKKEKRRLVLEQILKLEDKKRRFIRTTRLNQAKIRVSQRKREKIEDLTQTKMDYRLQQVLHLEKEKVDMEEKLDRFEDIGIALAMQKEQKHQCLLETIDNAPALYRKESEILEERHQRELVRYQVVMGLFMAFFAVLIITYICRFGQGVITTLWFDVKEKPAAGREGFFY